MSKPSRYALRGMYQYCMTEKEMVLYWGKLDGKMLEVGVNEIMNGDKSPVLRGRLCPCRRSDP